MKLSCRIPVTDGGNYCAWTRNQDKRRTREYDDRCLAELIIEVHAAQPGYGAQRITRELRRHGIPVGRRIVARLMRENGISGRARRKRRNLIKPDAGAAEVPDLVQREFCAPMPGLRLIGDFTCFPAAEG